MRSLFRSRSGRVAGLAVVALMCAATQPWTLLAQAPVPAAAKYARVDPADLKEWLTYLSSDALQGRQIFTEGYGLAAAYVADHLRQWGVKPLGDDGTYFQTVRLRGYKVTVNSSVTVEAAGKIRTFKSGDHVTFPVTAGGKQTLTFDGAEFVGYGLVNDAAQYDDYKGRDVKGKFVAMWQGAPQGTAPPGRGGRGGRGANFAVTTEAAKAAVTFVPAPAPPSPAEQAVIKAAQALADANAALLQAQQALQAQRGARGAAAGGRGGAVARGGAATADITTVQRVDGIVPPTFTGDEEFYQFLLAGAPVTVADLKAKAEKGEPLPTFSLPGVKITVAIDNTYDVVSQQLSKNVVGMIPGTDPALKDTYVLFGAHLDHIGYRTTAAPARGGGGGCRRTLDASGRITSPAPRPQAAGPALPFDQQDLINNGADDDGSGSTAELGIAKAFATGPKPKRSVVFIWHTGEEAGLYGSRYNADFPVVPLEKVQTQLNIDMIGRDDCDDRNGDYTNSVFVIGADRISTDLHNLVVQTDRAMPNPLKLDFEMNDPSDPESVYTRSDHYSYASKGIPIAFFTTGLHDDYHRPSDTVDKIVFPKMARIAQLVYEVGFSAADTARVLTRDNKGPRAGKGFEGTLP